MSGTAANLKNIAGNTGNGLASISSAIDLAGMDAKVTSVLQDIHQSLEEKEKKEKQAKEDEAKLQA